VGESGILVALDLPESVQNHLMHMGFVPNALVTALRHETAGAIRVREADQEAEQSQDLAEATQ